MHFYLKNYSFSSYLGIIHFLQNLWIILNKKVLLYSNYELQNNG